MDSPKTARLPKDFLLEVLEVLLAREDKDSHKSAACLAQSCRALRTSPAGKRARYFRALAVLAISVPESLPENLDYEREVLEASRWPHQEPSSAPRLLQSESASGEDLLGSSGYDGCKVGLSKDCKSLLHFKVEVEEGGPPQGTSQEKRGQAKVIPLRAPRGDITATTSDAQFCAVLHVYSVGKKHASAINIWNVSTGIRQTRLRWDWGEDELDSEHAPDYVAITSYYLVLYGRGWSRVHRWRNEQLEVHAKPPVVWSSDAMSYKATSLTLLPPHGLGVHALAAPSRDPDDPPLTHLHLYRLDQTKSPYVARISMYGASEEGSASEISVGAEVRPGSDGLVVIFCLSELYMLSVATLASILYPSSHEPGSHVTELGLRWTAAHTKKLDILINRNCGYPSVSGWRCVITPTWTDASANADDAPKIYFIDASPKHCQKPHTELAGHISPSCSPLIFAHKASKYLPVAAYEPGSELTATLKGARLSLSVHYEESEEEPTPIACNYTWRLGR